MVSNLGKYLFLIFIINTIFFGIPWFNFFTAYVFYINMVFCALILLMNTDLIKQVLLNKKYLPLLLINLINLIYFLFFEINNLYSLEYFLARFVTFSFIAIFLEKYSNYFQQFFFKHLYILLFTIAVLSLFQIPSLFSNRFVGIFNNPNALGSVMLVCFAIKFILFNNWKILDLAQLLLILLLIILCGSRISLLGVFVVVVLKHNISYKSIFLILFSFLLFYISYNFFSDASSIKRLINNDIIENRVLAYKYAFDTFKSKWLIGNGLSNYAYINQDLILIEDSHLDIGAHNGYLAVLVQYGLLFSFLFYFILFANLFKTLNYLRAKWDNSLVKLCLFIIVFTFLNAFVETMFTGINDFQTLLFWLVFTYLYSQSFQWKKNSK